MKEPTPCLKSEKVRPIARILSTLPEKRLTGCICKKNREWLDHTLLNYFEWDLFHDGYVSEFILQKDTLSFLVGCPNFIDRQDRCVEVMFTVTFYSVGKLRLQTDESVANGYTYLFSEIGTVRAPRRGGSIILQFLELDCAFCFESLDVIPDEPLQLRALLDSGALRTEQDFILH